MPVKSADELTQLTRKILVAVGASESNAGRVAEALISAHLAGHDSHGVQQLPLYIKDIKDGFIMPAAEPEVVQETASSALIRGHWTFGLVPAKQGMRLAIEKARTSIISIVALTELHHIGRLGEYAEMAAAENLVSIIAAGGFSEERPVAAPYGGRKGVLGTNPISIGFPAGDKPMIVDFATTITSGGKILLAISKGEKAPPGFLLDSDGNPTTDPSKFYEGGALLPFGGHKGFGVMMAVEFLGRILAGGDKYATPGRGGPTMGHQGVSMIAINPAGFQPLAQYHERAEEMMERVRGVPPAQGFDEVMAPGDPERRARETRQRDGIYVAESTWDQLMDIAKSLQVELPAS